MSLNFPLNVIKPGAKSITQIFHGVNQVSSPESEANHDYNELKSCDKVSARFKLRVEERFCTVRVGDRRSEGSDYIQLLN